MKKTYVFIIICLVVIVVSVAAIAYLAYLGAQTVTFPSDYHDRPEITGVTFQTGTATISVVNVGKYTLSISEVRVDDVTKPVFATGGSLTGSGPYDLDAGESGTITIGLSWIPGMSYTFEVITTGLNYGSPYRATAP